MAFFCARTAGSMWYCIREKGSFPDILPQGLMKQDEPSDYHVSTEVGYHRHAKGAETFEFAAGSAEQKGVFWSNC